VSGTTPRVLSSPIDATSSPRDAHARSHGAVVAWCLEHVYLLAVWASMLAWTGVLFSIVRSGYRDFRLARFDLGNMVQAVWSTAHGHPLEVTQGSTGEQIVRLGGHVDPILVLLTPFWLLWPSPLVLAFCQIALVSLGALPVFWLARRHLGSEKLACLLALAYLAYPWLSWSAISAIHPVTLAIPLLLYCVWFLDTDRVWAFAPFAILAALTGELMGVTIGVLGLWYAFAHKRRLSGLLIALAGAAWTIVAVYVVVRSFAGHSSVFYGFYDRIGGSPLGVAKTVFTDPGAIASTLFTPHVLAFLLWLGVPLAGLFLLAPGLAAVALPTLLADGLSDFRSMTDPRYHDIAGAVPFLIAATVLGITRLRGSRRGFAAVVVLAISAELAFVVGAWARAVGRVPFGSGSGPPATHVAALRDAVALVPPGAPVASTNKAGGHLSARRYVYSVPVVGRAQWMVVDTRDPWLVSRDSPLLTKHPARLRAFVAQIARSPSWHEVFREDGVLVFRRT
jgi:uncharacterized membrane protein